VVMETVAAVVVVEAEVAVVEDAAANYRDG
jgi:hypothetical protein